MVASDIVEEADTQASPQQIMESSPLRAASDSVEEADTQASPQQIMESSPLRAASDSVEETDTQASLPTNHGVLTTQGGK
jgi:uncharacterized protein YciI